MNDKFICRAGSLTPPELRAIPHNSKCRYGERGAADAKPKAQIILDAAKVSAASGGNSEPKQGQRSQSARGFCPRSTMRVPQPDIIEHFGNADAVPQPPERCLSRKAGIVRCCLSAYFTLNYAARPYGLRATYMTFRLSRKNAFSHYNSKSRVRQVRTRQNAVCFAFYSSQGAKPSLPSTRTRV